MATWETGLRLALLEIPNDITRAKVRKLCDEVMGTKGLEAKCKICGRSFKARNRNELQWRCPDCRQSEKTNKTRHLVALREQWLSRANSNRNKDIEAFQNGTGKATTSFWLIPDILSADDFDKLKVMPYRAFLITPYWKAISNYVRYRREYKCQLCGSPEKLNVHHRDYARRGEELEHWQTDLILLCHTCHSKFHTKFEVTLT